jgi:hypothetical protein
MLKVISFFQLAIIIFDSMLCFNLFSVVTSWLCLQRLTRNKQQSVFCPAACGGSPRQSRGGPGLALGLKYLLLILEFLLFYFCFAIEFLTFEVIYSLLNICVFLNIFPFKVLICFWVYFLLLVKYYVFLLI